MDFIKYNINYKYLFFSEGVYFCRPTLFYNKIYIAYKKYETGYSRPVDDSPQSGETPTEPAGEKSNLFEPRGLVFTIKWVPTKGTHFIVKK